MATGNKKPNASGENQYSEKPLSGEVSQPPLSPLSGVKRRLIRRIILATLLGLGVVVVVGYFYVTSAGFLEKTITENFNKLSHGTLSLKVSQASLFRGFIFENIVITSGPDFDNKPMVQLEKLTLLYNVYGFWAGDFGVHEVGIHKPHIYLAQKKNVWNVQTLMKPTEPKEQKEEEPEKEKPKEPAEPQEIKLPFSVRAFFKFVLEDFSIEVDGGDKSNAQPLEAGVKNFTFRFHFLTKKINRIPAAPLKFPSLIDTFLVQLNPQKSVDIYFRNKLAATQMPFDLHWLLAYDGSKEKSEFTSRLKIGHENIPLEYKGTHQLPLGLALNYNMFYDPNSDHFKIDHFQVRVLKQLWLNLAGEVLNVTKPDSFKADIKLDKSNIDLDGLYPYYVSFTGDKSIRFGGNISLAPLEIKGGMADLLVKGGVSLKKISARLPGMPVNLPFFNLYYEANADLTKKEGMPLNYAKAGWRGNLNGAGLKADIVFEPQKNVDIGIFVTNFNPAPFSGGQASGNFNVGVQVKGPAENHLKAKINVNAPYFYYVVDRGRSGLNRLSLDIDAAVDSPTPAFKDISVNVPKIALRHQNTDRRNGVALDANTSVRMLPGNMKIVFNLEGLNLHLRNLHPTFTEKTRDSLEDLLNTIRRSIILKGSTAIEIVGKQQKIDHATNIILEDFGIDDIWLKANLAMRPGLIEIPAVTLDGLKKSLKMNIHGEVREGIVEALDPKDPDKIIKQKGMAPDVNLELTFARPKLEKIFQDNAIVGTFGLKASFKNNVAKGALLVDKFSFVSPGAKVTNINMNFPFEHNLLMRKPLNLNAANKERIIKNYNFSENFNFTIESVEIPHPIDPVKRITLIYPQGNYPGLGAVMRYNENVFEMPVLQMYILNGLVTMQDTMFNVGRGRPREMEYMMQLQVKDIDLKQLIPPDKAKAIKDGSLRMDMLFYGNRLDQPVENLKGYVSIYKIGEEFGKQGLKVVKPDSAGAVDFVVDNSILVKKIDLDLKEGLVYARIVYQKRIFGRIVSPAGDQILQERIPIPEFMQRATREAEVYKQEKESGSET